METEEKTVDFMLSELLRWGRLTPGTGSWVNVHGETEKETTVLFVNCDTMFHYGVEDLEELPYRDIKPLYEMVENNLAWGDVRWACKRRNMQPTQEIISLMIEDREWDKEMRRLPSNPNNKHTLFNRILNFFKGS